MNKLISAILAALAALALVAGSMAAWHWLRADRNPASAILPEARPTLALADEGELSWSTPEAPVVSAPSPRQQAISRFPTELRQALQQMHDERRAEDWTEQPVLPNLERWRQQAEHAPPRAAALARSLRRCIGIGFSSIEEFQRRLQSELARIDSSNPEPDQRARVREQMIRHHAYQLYDFWDCEGLAADAARREYMRWLEHAARELGPSEARDRLRLSFIQDPFVDLPSAADRIGSVDEVIRRRDIAGAWLRELRERPDAGLFGAFRLSELAYSDLGELEPPDPVESIAWALVKEVSLAVHAASRPWPIDRATNTGELWETAPSQTRPEHAPYLEEGRRRGREHYLRIFGAPPG